MNLSELLGGSIGALYRSELVTSSRSITVSKAGWAVVSGMGGGAGGTKSSTYPPGNSAPWGVKAFRVAPGDVVAFTIGAGGAGNASGAALAGGATTITLNGVTIMTCQPGDAGVTSAKAPVNAQVIGADVWVPGRQPQAAVGMATGGAAVDCGSGTSNIGGGDSAVQLNSTATVGCPWGTHFWPFDVTFTSSTTGSGNPGWGAAHGNPAGMFAGGNGASDPSVTHPGGRGASAGISSNGATAAKAGGDGLGHIRLYANLG